MKTCESCGQKLPYTPPQVGDIIAVDFSDAGYKNRFVIKVNSVTRWNIDGEMINDAYFAEDPDSF